MSLFTYPIVTYPGPRGFLLMLSFFIWKFATRSTDRSAEPREKKASGEDRWESHFHAGSALDSCQRCHFLLTKHIFNPSNHMARRAIKNILQSETMVKSWWHESKGLDQRFSSLCSQRFVPIKKINKRSSSRRKICQERMKESLWDQGNRYLNCAQTAGLVSGKTFPLVIPLEGFLK